MVRALVRPAALLSGAAALLATQMWHTVRDRHTWPFCAYNMFNYRVPEQWQQFRIALYERDGRVTGPLDPWGLLPLEFFRVVSILGEVFLRNEDAALKTEFCERTLHRVNTTSWRDFDEVRGVVRSASGAPFAAFELHLVDVDARRCDPVDRASVLGAELVHRHDPEGVVREGALTWALVGPAPDDPDEVAAETRS